MYQIMSLNKKNLNEFRRLNENKSNFNCLNKNFFEIYDKCSFAQKVLLRRKVRLLKQDLNYIGYIWYNVNCSYKNTYIINALNIDNSETELVAPYKYLIDKLRKNSTFYYICENNDYNYKILKKIGFEKKEGTLILNLNLNQSIPLIIKDDINFEVLKIGRDEKKRCHIQNKIFKNNERIPLNLNDIYFDEMQSYYLNNGAIFIKKGETYIGYGQIILENNTPTIVNFGILEEFRGNDYSKCLLTYLLKIIMCSGFDRAKIKVKTFNYIALNLYKQMGFRVENRRYKWQIKT